MAYVLLLTSAYEAWLAALKKKDRSHYLRVVARIARIEAGNFGDHKSLGDGVSELRLDFGPGYRIYYTLRGIEVVMVLGGGDKSSQDGDIKAAKEIAKSLSQDLQQR